MAGKPAPNSALSKNGNGHPFQKEDPKPTRARLVSLLDPLGRKRYSEIERFLATVNGATSGLHFYPNAWGWAVRYVLGNKNDLCTLHLLPNTFEATVALDKDVEPHIQNGTLQTDLRRRIGRTRAEKGTRWVRLPIRSDLDYANFQSLINLKVEVLKSKKTKPEKVKVEKPKDAIKAKVSVGV
ncbi:MAG: DUF3788 family protein [Planctomycetes bacterium]|nr:DUF3788 family protein [Planctomycetota bacterium]